MKFGLALLELFDLNGKEPVKTAVRELACSDEFTIFALFLMRSWDEPDREIFQAAKKVRGWGRIHAVERLDPVDEEMERWLLAEGWDNTGASGVLSAGVLSEGPLHPDSGRQHDPGAVRLYDRTDGRAFG